MTQGQAILAHLRAGRCISALDAWKLGVGRLAARIYDLRLAYPQNIISRMVTVRGRFGPARVAVYYWREV
jgi:hypothetical protein